MSRIAGTKRIRSCFPSGPDFGKSDFSGGRTASAGRMITVFIFIGLFISIAFLGDLWPMKNVRVHAYAWFHPGNVAGLSMDFKLSPAMRYSFGSAARYYNSLAYLAPVRLVHYFIPDRLLSLRVLSILCSAFALLVLYRLTAILFCRGIGILFLFLLVTSPSYVENSRAFGYGPLTNLVICGMVYLLALILNRRKPVLKAALLSLLSYATLSLYVIGRLIIFLPVVVFVLYLKKYWLSLIVFSGLLIGLVLASDHIIGDTHFKIRDAILINHEWLQPREIDPSINVSVIWGRFSENLRWVTRYLSIKRSPFYHEGEENWMKPEAMINAVYWPFLCIGILICLTRRKTSNIILLGWFFLLALVPMISHWVSVRRFMYALTPIYLLIAIGLWWAYGFAIGLLPAGNTFRKRLPALMVICLSLIGGYNIHTFFSETARPEHTYSRRQLRLIASSISEKGDPAKVIRYNNAAMDLIWGNPYFDRPLIGKNIIDKMEYETLGPPRKPRDIFAQIEYAREEGGEVLYIHARQRPPAFFAVPEENAFIVGDPWWPDSKIKFVENNMKGEVMLTRLPGIPEVYFLYIPKPGDSE